MATRANNKCGHKKDYSTESLQEILIGIENMSIRYKGLRLLLVEPKGVAIKQQMTMRIKTKIIVQHSWMIRCCLHKGCSPAIYVTNVQ